MSKYQKAIEKAPESQVFTKQDYDKLRAGMKKYTYQRKKGQVFDRFQQYMVELGVASFSEQFAVVNPLAYYKYNSMLSRIEAFDEAEQERMFQQFPEEREAFEEKKRSWIQEISKAWKTLAPQEP